MILGISILAFASRLAQFADDVWGLELDFLRPGLPLVVAGQFSYIVSIATLGVPSNPVFLFLFAVELLGAPTFVYWQHQVAKAAGTALQLFQSSVSDPRTWLDKVTFDDATPKVTFKNLEVLTKKLATPEMLYAGKLRRLSFTEQGFDLPDRPEGLAEQAAAYAYAWEKVLRLGDAVDAFHYHRHVDHSLENKLRFGLWSNKPGTISEPDQKRPAGPNASVPLSPRPGGVVARDAE
mgnify:CR=1 FL=1